MVNIKSYLKCCPISAETKHEKSKKFQPPSQSFFFLFVLPNFTFPHHSKSDLSFLPQGLSVQARPLYQGYVLGHVGPLVVLQLHRGRKVFWFFVCFFFSFFPPLYYVRMRDFENFEHCGVSRYHALPQSAPRGDGALIHGQRGCPTQQS